MRLPDIIVLLGNSVHWQTEPLIGAAQGKQIDACQSNVSLYCLFGQCKTQTADCRLQTADQG